MEGSTPSIRMFATGSSPADYQGRSNRTGTGESLCALTGYWGVNTTPVGQVLIETSTDTSNKDNGSILLKTSPNASAGLTTRMVVDSAGKVGINSTAPAYELDVAGDLKAGASSSQGVILTSPNGTKFTVTVSNAGALSASSV